MDIGTFIQIFIIIIKNIEYFFNNKFCDWFYYLTALDLFPHE